MLFVPDEIRQCLSVRPRSQFAPSKRACALLEQAGLRPTRQRAALATFLFQEGNRHVTAEDLWQEAGAAGVRLSLATIYNTLNQFAEAGLLCKVCINGERAYFDTDLGNHQHFFVKAENRLIDIPAAHMPFAELPEPPEGYSIAKVDVVIQLVRNKSGGSSRPRSTQRAFREQARAG
jgi:Fur family transcriptional regulator, iron response regulator